MADDRIGDVAVLKQGQSGLVAREQPGAEVIEKGLEGVEHVKHGDILGAPGDEVMKSYVLDSQPLSLLNELVLLGDRAAQLISVFLCAVFGGVCGNLRFEQEAEYHKVVGKMRLA